MTTRPATSHDVAARAGVSQSTVSHVFTGRTDISAPTRDRVLAAAKELNYRPNLAARSMRTRRSGRIAVVMPLTSWNLAPVLEGATAAAREHGYALEVHSLPESASGRRARLQEIVDSAQYEGVLSFSPLEALGGEVAVGDGTTVMAVAEYDEALHSTGELADAAPLVAMMERLVELGHRRFFHVSGALDWTSARARRAAYEDTVARLGVESMGTFEGDWSGRSGVDAMLSLPDDAPPLAVIAANDLVATGVVRGAHTRGWEVPGEVSVTGWDDSAAGAFQVPSLTSVFIDRVELGHRATGRLIAAMRGEQAPAPTQNLQEVVWRESTGAPVPRD